jgi:DNA uptake protein ComE-like DNA-binding protein
LPIDILERKLKATGANKVFIENLIAVRDVESFVPFSTIEELLKIKGIGDKSLLKTLSHWNK